MTPARCPLCGGEQSVVALTARDRNRALTPERYTYRRCGSCGSLFLDPRPADMSRYYDHDYYPFGSDGEPDWKHDPRLRHAEEFRVALLLGHVEPGRLIEIGSGTGGFAAAAKDRGFGVTAVEMDEHCCRYLSDSLGVETIRSEHPVEAIEPLAPARVVAMWHVLEHLPDPRETLAAAAAKLEPGGILAIGVPNPQSLQFRLLRGRWAHLDAPRHLTLAPAGALLARARELGLDCVELTADEPFSRLCNEFGWMWALRRHPERGAPSTAVRRGGLALSRLAAPLEHGGMRGATLLLLLRKPS